MSKLGIVGVTGVVGNKFLEVIDEYNLVFDEIRLFASKKSEGKIIKFQNKDYVINSLNEGCFLDLDYVLFSAGSKVSEKWCLEAEKEGCIVIDNSSAFRFIDDFPLIVSEVNMDDFYLSKRKIIANPNCSTMQCIVILDLINKINKLKKVYYSTYQAVSGAGKKGIDDLLNIKKGCFSLDINKTCIPIIGDILDNNYSNEEMKMIKETKKILKNNDLEVSATCVRVPILNSHAVSVYLECENDIDLDLIKKELAKSSSIVIMDDLGLYPNSIIANNNDLIYVGRIRINLDNPKGMWFYCVSDNLRKGAASNAIQILRNLILKDQ